MNRLCLLLLLCVPLAAAEPTPNGLYVQEGVLMKEGQPYRGIGANYFSLFSRLLHQPDDTSSLSNLAALAQARIPFVRFMAGGFWPAEQRLYLTNRPAYFERLDRVVRCAETNRIGLVPSLFWHILNAPDLVGEHLDQYGNPNSRTIAYIRSYTKDVVERYKDSPAIWGWEFGNEYTLDCDLPNAAQHRPPVVPDLGTARERTERDEAKFTAVRGALIAFAETVRASDPHRVILSGNALPRASAWHNVREKKWTADTEAQFAEILLRDNPDPIDSITVHIYPEASGVYSGGATNLLGAVGLAERYARQAGKPLFIGEFGAPRRLGSPQRQRALFQESLDAIVRHRVPLAAFWVFDLSSQDKDWNVTFANDRAFMIDLVARANERLRRDTK